MGNSKLIKGECVSPVWFYSSVAHSRMSVVEEAQSRMNVGQHYLYVRWAENGNEG